MNYYYRDKAGHEIGPLALDTLAKFRLAGVLDGDTPVRAADSVEWKLFRDIIADAPVGPSPSPAPQPAGAGSGVLSAGRNKLVFVVLAVLVAVLIFHYGLPGTPSAGEGERAIQNRIREESEGRITLAKFQKTNGQEGEVLGVKMYGLEFEAEIEFTEDCKWSTGMLGQGMSFRTSKPVAQPKSGFSWNSFLDTTTNPGTLVKRGQRVKLSGVVRFVKKENGWAVDGVELTKADVGSASQVSPAQEPETTAPKVQAPPSTIKLYEETREALADRDREYSMSLSPRPDSGPLQQVVGTAGLSSIRFVEFDGQQKKLKAVVKQSGYWNTNSLTLSGGIDGEEIRLQDADIALTLQQAPYSKLKGEYRSGQTAGTLEVSLHNSYLLDEDPDISDSLFWIHSVGKALFMKGNAVWTKTNDTQTVRFPDSLSEATFEPNLLSGLRRHQYLYVAGIELDFSKFGKDRRIILFQQPSSGIRVVPIYCIDQVVRKIAPAELEKRIKEQTGRSVAQVIGENAAAREKASALDQGAARSPRGQRALEFTIQGIKLRSTLAEIRRRVPGLQPVRSTNSVSTLDPEASGSWKMSREQGLPDANWVMFDVRDKQVYRMRINYSLEDAQKLGGWEAILKGLQDQFGEPDADSRGIQEQDGKRGANYRWKVSDAYASFSFSYSEARGYVAIIAESTRL